MVFAAEDKSLLRISMSQMMGIIALVLSLVSLLYTFQYNWNQNRNGVCLTIISRDAIGAMRARDEAILTLAQSNRQVVAGDPTALKTYDAGLQKYLDIIHRSPLPNDECLYH